MNDYRKFVGKIKSFNGVTGNIVTDKDSFVFPYTSLQDDASIGDLVIFKANENGIASDIYKSEIDKDLNQLFNDISRTYNEQLQRHHDSSIKLFKDENTSYLKK